mmetsp:Transcript_14124/g.28903  ORF Transcript_14124/g.28903 Transcript_14124/m.28903 type:complete len:554 (-) Transcript_14124:1172-2833(-)
MFVECVRGLWGVGGWGPWTRSLVCGRREIRDGLRGRVVCQVEGRFGSGEEESRVLRDGLVGIRSGQKGEQQRALLAVRKLPPQDALRLLEVALEESKFEFVRATAAVLLGQLEGELSEEIQDRCLHKLVDILRGDKDYGVRAAAAAGCGYLEDPRAVQALKAAYREDDQWQVHFAIVVSLGNIRDREAVEFLLGLSKSPQLNSLVMQGIIGALGEIGDPRAIPFLISQVRQVDDWTTRERLISALEIFASQDVTVLNAIEHLKRDCRTPQDSAPRSLPDSQAPYNPSFTMEDVRQHLERSMSRMSDVKDAFEDLVARCPEGTRGEFRNVLRQLKTGSTAEKLVASVRLRTYPDELIRESVKLCKLQGDSSERVRSAVLYLLSQDTTALIDALRRDPDQSVRSGALNVLVERNQPWDEQVKSACIDAFLHDPHWLVRLVAVSAIGAMCVGDHQAEDTVANALLPGGIRGLGELDCQVVRRYCLTTLGLLGATRHLSRMVGFLQSPDSLTRVRLAAALGMIDAPESVNALELLTLDTSPDVVEAARKSLAHLQNY